jgi:hypothetical protein
LNGLYCFPTAESTQTFRRKPYNSRKRITPITKEKKKTEHTKSVDSLPSKVKERLRQVIDTVCETRPWIQKDEVYRWATEFIENLNIVFPKSKDKISILCLVCVILGSRIYNVFMDLHVVSMQLGETLKDTQKMMFSVVPSLTNCNDYGKRVIQSFIDPPRTSLLLEYESMMDPLIRGFSKDASILESDREYYRMICEKIFCSLEGDNDYDYEKQFCVTPDKVLVYGVFEIIRRKVPDVTERSICEYLSEKFRIPRVTIEKMKRLVVKYIRPVMNP